MFFIFLETGFFSKKGKKGHRPSVGSDVRNKNSVVIALGPRYEDYANKNIFGR